MLSRLLVGLLGLFLVVDGAYDGGGAVLVVVDPGSVGEFVSLLFLLAVDVDPLFADLGNGHLDLLLFEAFEAVGVEDLFEVVFV